MGVGGGWGGQCTGYWQHLAKTLMLETVMSCWETGCIFQTSQASWETGCIFQTSQASLCQVLLSKSVLETLISCQGHSSIGRFLCKLTLLCFGCDSWRLFGFSWILWTEKRWQRWWWTVTMAFTLPPSLWTGTTGWAMTTLSLCTGGYCWLL